MVSHYFCRLSMWVLKAELMCADLTAIFRKFGFGGGES